MPFEDLAGDGQADQGRDLSTIFAQPLQEGGMSLRRPCAADSFRKGKAKFVFKHDVGAEPPRLFLSWANLGSAKPG